MFAAMELRFKNGSTFKEHGSNDYLILIGKSATDPESGVFAVAINVFDARYIKASIVGFKVIRLDSVIPTVTPDHVNRFNISY